MWTTLGGIRPPGADNSLEELGLVAAVSTDGAVVRVLLRLPAALCLGAERGDLLDDIEESVRNVSSLGRVELYTKPSWPGWAAAVPNNRRAPFSAHSTCFESAVAGSSQNGWVLDGFQQRISAASRDEENRPDGVHVMVRARIAPETTPIEVA
ncbi:hypothetical protein [Halosaccharopolyspora lacisalsi]|uniref:hypothetical protein n=1 Tax=Halosaccharopolyspora lacisalsi TaxID=1000566 RepID=UPI0038B3A8EB